MRTNDLEREIGLSKHTIRYYEKEGFINPVRDENGYRNYSDEDVQVLKLVKFLRSLDISIDDVKSILEGKLNFQECLKINQIYLDKHIDDMKEIKQTIDSYVDKELPLIPALADVKTVTTKSKLGIHKTTKSVSLGRKLTKEWAIRQLLYGFLSSLFISIGMGRFVFMAGALPIGIKFPFYLVLTVIVEVIFISYAFRQTAGMMIDNSMDQSVEFLNDGIRYYKFENPMSNLKYFIAVLRGKDEKLMHYYRYEDIKEVEVITKQRYMNVGSPIAYEVYVTDFYFEFNDGVHFYFLWPMILDDDARFVAAILEEKVSHVKDEKQALYAMKNGINLNDYYMQK